MKSERLIAQIREAGDPNSAQAQKAAKALRAVGPSAIPKIIEAMGHADKSETVVYVEVLTGLITPKSLPEVVKGLAEGNQRAVAGVAWALSSNKQYNANKLLDFLDDEELSKAAIIGILAAHKERLNVRNLLTKAYELEPAEKAAIFKIIAEVAEEDMVPELVSRIEGKDPLIRVHLINILSRFNLPEVRGALEGQLKDRNKMVRQAALAGLGRMGKAADIATLCSLLRDPEVEVQSKAVDVITRIRHPDTVRHLVNVLKDESEYARRSAVEVLNEICEPDSVKHLLNAIKDEDWWVRSRAADALAKIGGPKVIDATIGLIKDEDEDIRRAAIEILNQTKDSRAVNHLIAATQDKDWWVRERAADALAEIGDAKAVPSLLRMLQGEPKSIPAAVRALGKLGDHKVIGALQPMLARPEKEIKIEAIHALARLADEQRADAIRTYLHQQAQTSDETVRKAVNTAIGKLDDRFSPTAIAAREQAEKFAEPAKTLLIDSSELADVVASHERDARLDISTLNPGDVIEGRYRFIQKIGKGAFGTVLLMEDTVVDERLILKFLNPNVSSDEEMMKRFVHELRFSRKITHRNVIRIYDFLYMGGNYAISMEYFPSHTLGNELVDDKPMDFGRAIRVAIDIATGMSVAHQVGIVHRDLKPANILINDEDLVKIVDFGVAAARSSGDTQLTKTGYVIGSPKYMAPEQILGKKVDEKADIYSLGVILYEMVSGVPPYSKGDHMAVMYQHVQGKALPVQEVNPKVPDRLAEIVTTAMSVDRVRRIQTMDEFRKALESAA
jgi:serine/threonine-protein kinase